MVICIGIDSIFNTNFHITEVIQKLLSHHHKIYFCDTREDAFEANKKCLLKHMPFLNHDWIIFCPHQWMFKCDVMIDSNIEHLLGGVTYDRICINTADNQDVCDEAYGIYRIDDWTAIPDIINELNME